MPGIYVVRFLGLLGGFVGRNAPAPGFYPFGLLQGSSTRCKLLEGFPVLPPARSNAGSSCFSFYCFPLSWWTRFGYGVVLVLQIRLSRRHPRAGLPMIALEPGFRGSRRGPLRLERFSSRPLRGGGRRVPAPVLLCRLPPGCVLFPLQPRQPVPDDLPPRSLHPLRGLRRNCPWGSGLTGRSTRPDCSPHRCLRCVYRSCPTGASFFLGNTVKKSVHEVSHVGDRNKIRGPSLDRFSPGTLGGEGGS